jgi:hypothetical protein
MQWNHTDHTFSYIVLEQQKSFLFIKDVTSELRRQYNTWEQDIYRIQEVVPNRGYRTNRSVVI